MIQMFQDKIYSIDYDDYECGEITYFKCDIVEYSEEEFEALIADILVEFFEKEYKIASEENYVMYFSNDMAYLEIKNELVKTYGFEEIVANVSQKIDIKKINEKTQRLTKNGFRFNKPENKALGHWVKDV